MKRKDFVKTISIGSLATMMPVPLISNSLNSAPGKGIRFGVVTDTHKDIMHDADERLLAFIDDAKINDFDFIIHLGDFCRPYDYNKGFMDIWNSFPGAKYHVLGNHDMDGGFTREQTIEYWKAVGKYYSFDIKGFHFVVLDGNDVDPSPNNPGGYARYISDEQLDWLAKDLKNTSLPTIIFSHQGLDNDMGGITNATKSRLVLERANREAGFQKVIAAFSGHHHQDYHNEINGIQYLQINSMAYQWLGDKYLTVRYSQEIDEKFPWIKYTVPYKDPLWARVDISESNITIRGKKSEFVGPSHIDLGMDKHEYGYEIVPVISDRKIKL